MCEFRQKHWLGGGEPIRKDYKILSIWGETKTAWFFWAKPIRLNYMGKITDIDEPKRLYGFPKKEEIGTGPDKNPIYDDLPPPKFLDKMRNKAVMDGKLSMSWDDIPPMEDREIPFQVEEQ